MNFDLHNIKLTILVGFFNNDRSQTARHIQIPIDPHVQHELGEMLRTTASRLGLPGSATTMQAFDPAEKYGSEAQLKLPLTTPYLLDLASIVTRRNLSSDESALDMVAELVYYYAVFTDEQDNVLHAFRRANQFKGVTKSRLVFLEGGILTLLTRPVFRLDLDFDYLVSGSDVFILHPSGLEFTTGIHGQILQASAANAQSIAASVSYLDVTGIIAYASNHARSARLLAAIRSRNNLHLIDRILLVQACQSYGVAVQNPIQGQLSPDTGHEYDFLCILDRRAYTANLIPDQAEKYEAASRTQKSIAPRADGPDPDL